MESVLVAARSELPDARQADESALQPMASDPPGFELNQSHVYVVDAAAYLSDMRSEPAGEAALAEALALLPGDAPASFREVLYSGGTPALRALLTAWASRDAVVWDSEDRPARLVDYASRL